MRCRRKLAPFLTSFATDIFYMYQVATQPEPDVWTGVFKPFSNELWAAICGLVIFHGMAISLLTNKNHVILHRGHGKTQEKLSLGSSKSVKKAAALVPRWQRALTSHMYEISKDIYDSALGYVTGSGNPVESDDGVGKKMLSIGYAFFVLVVLASCEPSVAVAVCARVHDRVAIEPKASESVCVFEHADTANLASLLVASAASLSFKDLSDAMSHNAKVCLGAGIRKQYADLLNLNESSDRLLAFPADPPFDNVDCDGKYWFNLTDREKAGTGSTFLF